jgi:predicted PurR-regulated permease PerM
MTIAPPVEPSTPPSQPPVETEGSVFLRRLRNTTYGILLFVMTIYLLEKFRDMLQPLFVAVFLGFLMQPLHRWLVRRGIPSLPAYGVILVLVALGLFALGSILYANITEVAIKLPTYQTRLEAFEEQVREIAQQLPFRIPGTEGHFLREFTIAPDYLVAAARTALGQFRDFSSWAGLALLYLVFLTAEKVSFPRRITMALGDAHGQHIMDVVESINQAIGDYVAVKTLVSALAGFVSYIVLAVFDVEFAATWGVLIFLFNYIPYLGSLVAVALPVMMCFLQFTQPWIGIVVAILLIAIQQLIGTWIEPRMAGERLDVSPLLIVLSLAFWFTVWGIVGAILAVPLLVIVKIILANIPETRPVATLISNR